MPRFGEYLNAGERVVSTMSQQMQEMRREASSHNKGADGPDNCVMLHYMG